MGTAELFAKLIASYSITTVFIVLFIGIPAIIKFIGWCKTIWAKREAFKQENVQKGVTLEQDREKEEHRFQSGEDRMTKLEKAIKNLTEEIKAIRQDINKEAQENKYRWKKRAEKDKWEFRSWIKDQHEKWMHIGAIDSHSLEIIDARFELYSNDGGNGWAKKMYDDIHGLPAITAITLKGEEI